MKTSSATPTADVYATVWRWHFYAGLFAAPFLLILSITGAIYLFNDELNDWIYPELRFATTDGPALPPSRWIDSVMQAYPDARITRIDTPTAEGRSTMLHVRSADDAALRVFVDPASAQVLGSFEYSRTLVGFADRMHGSLLLGDIGDAIVEIAACWTVVLVVTGLYLWWPRNRGPVAGTWVPRLRARGRTFWRDLHKITGLYAAVLIVFLVMSGLPWATVWGGQFLTPISNALGVGYPTGNRTKSQVASATVGEVVGEVPWTLQQAPMPQSAPAGGAHAHHHPMTSHAPGPQAVAIDIDEATRILAANGMSGAYRLTLPDGPTGAFTAYTYPDQPEGQRTLHIDRYTGAVLGDLRFEDYGAVAKLVEWGVAIHLGNYFGRLNQIIMLVTCLMIIALVATGLVMWWRRRPVGAVGAPVSKQPLRASSAILLMLLLTLCFPLAGASLVLALLVELAWHTLKRRDSRRLSGAC